MYWGKLSITYLLAVSLKTIFNSKIKTYFCSLLHLTQIETLQFSPLLDMPIYIGNKGKSRINLMFMAVCVLTGNST